MYKDKKILAIIPARGGSKGIPNKNIQLVDNKPLIAYTIEEALKVEYLDNIIVSTDSKRIAEIAKEYGAEIPFLRPDWLASDTAKTIDVLIHAIEMVEEAFDYVVLLQPTQPLRKSIHIKEAIEKIIDKKWPSLVSVSKVKEHPILMREINEDESLSNLLNIGSTVRRQEFKEYYKVNGAIYINEINNLSPNTSLNDNRYSYIMDEKYDVDIDEMIDLKIFEMLLNEK